MLLKGIGRRVSQKKRYQDFMFTVYILEYIIFTLDHQKSLQIEKESGGNNLLFTKLIYLQKGENFSICLTPKIHVFGNNLRC